MFKQIFIVRGEKSEEYLLFKKRVLSLTSNLRDRQNLLEIKTTVTDQKPPFLSIIPFSKEKIAVISVKSSEKLKIPEIENADGFDVVFKVEEAIPVGYQKDWQDGDQTPGVGLLTLFRKKENIDYETFIDRWHYGHTPLSLKIHPLWNYNRNVVKEKLAGSETWYDGIVEEHVRDPKELFNPFKFFGNPLIIIPRMLNVYTDVKSFIDYGSIETYLVNEYIIKSQNI